MYSLGVNKLGVTNVRGGFNPLSLFASGEEGVWFDPSDLSTLFQNSDGTGAPAVGQPVGYMADKSGNGHNATQPTSIKRPILRTANGLYYLEFGGDDKPETCLTTTFIDFTGTDAMSVFAGVKKNDDDNNNTVVELGNNVGFGEAFRLMSFKANSNKFGFSSAGDISVSGNVRTAYGNAVAGASTAVFTGVSKISTPSVLLREDGTTVTTVTSNQGTGVYDNDPLNIGARNNGTTNQLDGNIYSLIIRNVVSTDAVIANTEAYVARKTGVTL